MKKITIQIFSLLCCIILATTIFTGIPITQYPTTAETTPTIGQPGFDGYLMENTDLTYAGARYYDPTTGCFDSIDPLNSITSPYGYCYGNPVGKRDPTGLDPQPPSPPRDPYGFLLGNGQPVFPGGMPDSIDWTFDGTEMTRAEIQASLEVEFGQALRQLEAALSCITTDGEVPNEILLLMRQSLREIDSIIRQISGGISVGFGLRYGLRARIIQIRNHAGHLSKFYQNDATQTLLDDTISMMKKARKYIPPGMVPPGGWFPTFIFILPPDSTNDYLYYFGMTRPPNS